MASRKCIAHEEDINNRISRLDNKWRITGNAAFITFTFAATCKQKQAPPGVTSLFYIYDYGKISSPAQCKISNYPLQETKITKYLGLEINTHAIVRDSM